METAFHYDLADKQLHFKLKEGITTKPGVELKAKGFFNTTTGTLSYAGTLRGVLKTGTEYKDKGSTPLKLGVGVFAAGADLKKGMPEPQLHASAKKTISLLDGPNTVVSAKAWANWDPKSGQLTARKAVVKASHKWLGFTKRQDLKLSAGVDVDWPLTAREPKATPFGQVKENNWAVNYRHNRWFVTYDL